MSKRRSLWETINDAARREATRRRTTPTGSEAEHRATVSIYDGLGSDTLREISVGDLKWRFFTLGLQLGVALQMFAMCIVLVLLQASNEEATHCVSFAQTAKSSPLPEPEKREPGMAPP